MTSIAETHLIQGRRVAMPVHVRDAVVASAMFPVPAATAQAIIAYSGLDVAEPLPGRAICSLACIDYRDGDLDTYHEFAVAFLVRPPGEPRGARGPGGLRGLRGLRELGGLRDAGVFIHWLPVDQPFTLEAGRTIWGFPKELADIPAHLDGRVKRCAVRLGGATVVELAIRPGVPVPTRGASAATVTAYSCLDDVTRRIPWTMTPSGVRMRPGGARVRLGDHPAAEELRRLDLHGAHAISSSTVDRVRMRFGPAVRFPPPGA